MANEKDMIQKIKDVIKIMKDTDVAEIELKEGDQTVRISRHSQMQQFAYPPAGPMTYANAPTHIGIAQAGAAQGAAQSADSGKETRTGTTPALPPGHQVRSPMVGTMYTSPSPGAKTFVDIGQKIEAGDVLCIIEAMKMLNHIEADKSGTLAARLVENGQPVEFDQPLFVIA